MFGLDEGTEILNVIQNVQTLFQQSIAFTLGFFLVINQMNPDDKELPLLLLLLFIFIFILTVAQTQLQQWFESFTNPWQTAMIRGIVGLLLFLLDMITRVSVHVATAMCGKWVDAINPSQGREDGFEVILKTILIIFLVLVLVWCVGSASGIIRLPQTKSEIENKKK
jgi:hypothetical protein